MPIRFPACLAILLALAAATDLTAAGEEISITTEDGVHLAATLSIPDDLAMPNDLTTRDDLAAPAVILIHQGGSDRSEWDDVVPRLVERGRIVLAYDVRGHGASDPVDSIRELFDDPRQAPRDLDAVVAYLRGREEVDGARLAVVGASIGGNLACVASARGLVETAVAISVKTSAVEHLAATDEPDLRSLFLISSAGDQGGQRAAWAEELYARTKAPRKLRIVEGSSSHGVSIFRDDPGVVDEILEWLEENQ